MESRFHDTNYWPERDAEYLVKCPECSERAIVRKSVGFRCSSCTLTLRSGDDRWFSSSLGIARKRCSQCGRWLDKRISHHTRNPETNITCPGCKIVNRCSISWYGSTDAAVDPIYGCELLLKTDFRGNTLWAWNLEHLDFLEDYIGCSLRERIPNRNGSMASRLPQWMKEAKNRDALMKSIQQVKANAQTKG